jgi:L-seryl-tRNA(Ser) seleniumtransferase
MEERGEVKRDPRRRLPAADRVIRQARSEGPWLPAWAVGAGVRRALEQARLRLSERGEASGDLAGLVATALAHAEWLARPHPARVVNATGVVLHTNLGRAVLAPGAARAAAAAASSYSDLELDLREGERGDRLAQVNEELALLSGAEAAHVVNNNAAALLLAVNSLAHGREVIVSRGELVEIGGSFRIPEICARAGVTLVEVGSTNRTHAADYERALGARSALLLKVHRSNFEQRGFVSEVGLAQLAEIGRRRGVPVLEDLGSGLLVELGQEGAPAFPPESYALARLRLGADVVCFSADKLLGGPQAGILLGSAARIEAMRANPLSRALRLDKLCIAALDWTLKVLLEGRCEQELPVLRQLLAPAAVLDERARALADRLAKVGGSALEIEVRPEAAPIGAGSLPSSRLETWVVVLRSPHGAQALAAALRTAPIPVIARIREGAVLIDVRTLLDDDVSAIEAALGLACGLRVDPAGSIR